MTYRVTTEYTENITILNLGMVRLSLMSMVKSIMIRARAHGEILDLAILAVRKLSLHFSFSWELPLCSCLARNHKFETNGVQ